MLECNWTSNCIIELNFKEPFVGTIEDAQMHLIKCVLRDDLNAGSQQCSCLFSTLCNYLAQQSCVTVSIASKPGTCHT